MSKRTLTIRLLPWIILLLVTGYFIFELDRSKKQIDDLVAVASTHASIISDTGMHAGLLAILQNLFEQIDDELQNGTDRSLSEETINRISVVSEALLPGIHSYVEKDSLSMIELSRERGFLLKQLIAYNLADETFSGILERTTFSRAYLKGADLRGVNLGGIELSEAHLKGADLRTAVLDTADLRGANLWGAKLQRISAREARMNRADLRWANMDSADLRKSILDGAFLKGAKVRRAFLREATAAYAFFQQSMFENSDLTGMRMFKTDLRDAHFQKANLRDADLRECDISGAELSHADLSGTLFRNTGVREENWLALLDTWKVTGADDLESKYRVEKTGTASPPFSIIQVNTE